MMGTRQSFGNVPVNVTDNLNKHTGVWNEMLSGVYHPLQIKLIWLSLGNCLERGKALILYIEIASRCQVIIGFGVQATTETNRVAKVKMHNVFVYPIISYKTQNCYVCLSSLVKAVRMG
jgi:hypothetical protein